VFDDFAPKLTVHNHVYGITRRGFGASGYADATLIGESLGEDVLAVIDAFKLGRPILVGHSVAGAEMSWMANAHANQIAGLVYLEAGYSYAFDNGKKGGCGHRDDEVEGSPITAAQCSRFGEFQCIPEVR